MTHLLPSPLGLLVDGRVVPKARAAESDSFILYSDFPNETTDTPQHSDSFQLNGSITYSEKPLASTSFQVVTTPPAEEEAAAAAEEEAGDEVKPSGGVRPSTLARKQGATVGVAPEEPTEVREPSEERKATPTESADRPSTEARKAAPLKREARLKRNEKARSVSVAAEAVVEHQPSFFAITEPQAFRLAPRGEEPVTEMSPYPFLLLVLLFFSGLCVTCGTRRYCILTRPPFVRLATREEEKNGLSVEHGVLLYFPLFAVRHRTNKRNGKRTCNGGACSTCAIQRRLFWIVLSIAAIAAILFVRLVPMARASSWNPTLLANTEAFQTIDGSDANADLELRFGDAVNERLIFERNQSRFRFTRALHVAGKLSASGAVTASGGLTVSGTTILNAGQTNANTRIATDADANTFFVHGTNNNVGIGTSSPEAELKLEILGTASGDVLHGERRLTSSGGLHIESAFTGATTFFGAGLTNCSDGTNDKLLWNSSTGTFSCGSDQNDGGSGLTQAEGDERYVEVAGDTMTGALTVRNNNVTASGVVIRNGGNTTTLGRFAFVAKAGSGVTSATGSNVLGDIPMIFAGTIDDVECHLSETADDNVTEVDVKIDGTSIFSTTCTVDAGETDSTTAATPPVINTANDDFTDGAVITVDTNTPATNPGKDVSVRLSGTRTSD